MHLSKLQNVFVHIAKCVCWHILDRSFSSQELLQNMIDHWWKRRKKINAKNCQQCICRNWFFTYLWSLILRKSFLILLLFLVRKNLIGRSFSTNQGNGHIISSRKHLLEMSQKCKNKDILQPEMIYSIICLYRFLDTKIFGSSFVSKSIRISHSDLKPVTLYRTSRWQSNLANKLFCSYILN